MGVLLANNASSTLVANLTAVATSLTVVANEASRFPTLKAGEWFPLTLIDAAGNSEIVKVTAKANAVLTIARGQEGTTPKAFVAGSRCDLRLTAGAVTSIMEELRAEASVEHDALEALVASKIAALVDSSPASLDTLKELATALGNDPNFAATVTTQIGLKLDKAGGAITGTLSMENSAAPNAASAPLRLVARSVRAWYLQIKADGRFRIVDETGNAEVLSLGPTGDLWTKQLGDLNARIEARAAAFADDRLSKAISGFEVATWANGGGYTVPHGLGRVPWFVSMGLRCTVAINGYKVGDVVNAFTADKSNNDGSGVIFGGYCHADANNLYLYPGPNGIVIRNLTNGGQYVPNTNNFNLVGICG